MYENLKYRCHLHIKIKTSLDEKVVARFESREQCSVVSPRFRVSEVVATVDVIASL
jgi:hypothetical protein